jgi:hypothetical protein
MFSGSVKNNAWRRIVQYRTFVNKKENASFSIPQKGPLLDGSWDIPPTLAENTPGGEEREKPLVNAMTPQECVS